MVSVDDHIHQDHSKETLDSDNGSIDNGLRCYCQENKPDKPMVICVSEHC